LSAAIAFAWILYFEMVRLNGMTASAWDVAINQHVIWNVSTGQGFYTSFQRADRPSERRLRTLIQSSAKPIAAHPMIRSSPC